MLNRLGTPADVAQLVAFLATSEPCFITGQHFVIDGFQWSCWTVSMAGNRGNSPADFPRSGDWMRCEQKRQGGIAGRHRR